MSDSKTALRKTRYPGIYEKGTEGSDAVFVPRKPPVYVAVCSYRVGPGKYRQRWFTALKLEDVKKQKEEFGGAVRKGHKPSDARMSLEAFLVERWLPHVQGERKANTARRYESVTRVHVLENERAAGVRSLPLRQIGLDDLEDFYRTIPSAHTRRMLHASLSSAFAWAVKKRILTANPCREVELASVQKNEPRHLDVAEARRMLEAVRFNPRLEASVALGLQAGLRIAEVVGLQWGDVNLRNAQMTVRRTYWGNVKTDKQRTFELPRAAVAVLKRWKATQAEQLLEIGRGQDDETHVITNRLGEGLSVQKLDHEFRELCRASNFKATFHTLRHTNGSLSLAGGADVYTVARRLGHNPMVLLNTYAHLIGSADAAAARVLDTAFAG